MTTETGQIPRKKKISLINVVMEGDYQYEQEIPLGLAYIGSFLRKHGYEVIFRQCFAGKFSGDKREKELCSIAEVEADIYGFQLNIVNYQAVKSVVEKIKSNRQNVITIFGGPFLVSLSEDILKNEPLYDFIIRGEGEKTMLELIQAIESNKKDFSEIKGIVWRNDKKQIITNEFREVINGLDALPFPARDLMETMPRDSINNGLTDCIRMVTSRGCIGQCSFCCVNFYNKVQKGKIWRGRSARNVVDELEYLNARYGAKVFNLSDSSFEDPGRLGKIRTKEICEEIIRRGLQISMKIYLRSETMKTQDDIELLKLYKRAGVDVVIPGLECGTDYELKLYGKNATVQDNYRTMEILKGLNCFYVLLGFIMFGPYSTIETIKANIEFLRKIGMTDNLMTVANTLMLLRDSKIYKMLKREGRVIESDKFWELPKYKMKDPLAERMSKHWQNVFARFPVTQKVNKLQVNIGNLVSRMMNPLNAKVFGALKNEYVVLKSKYEHLTKEFGGLQYAYFIQTLNLIVNDCPDDELARTADNFFFKTYKDYLPLYNNLYNNFLDKVSKAGFGFSGLVFKHFTSAMSIEETTRVDVEA